MKGRIFPVQTAMKSDAVRRVTIGNVQKRRKRPAQRNDRANHHTRTTIRFQPTADRTILMDNVHVAKDGK